MPRRALLHKSDLFADLSKDELELVAGISEERRVDTGTVICKQGTVEENIYVVESGSVAIVLEVGYNSNRQVQAASHFESCGWSAMVEPFISTATIKATEKTKLLSVPGEDLRRLCESHPEMGNKIYHAVARVVAKRLRQAYDQLLGITCQD